MIIAVDFDGTIVKHRYPKIGDEIPFAIDTLKALQKDGHLIIMWTYRAGDKLDEAVQFCRDRGFEFYAVNKSFPEEVFEVDNSSRKINADLFIDDRNYGGLPDWGEMYAKLTKNGQKNQRQFEKKKNFFLRIGEKIEYNRKKKLMR
jgi:hydroxymethylpyrimidine pyrophosphatase-like HAD family hydrolase